MENLFCNPLKNLLYSPMSGVYPSKVNLHTPFIKDIAKVFFKILDDAKLEYYLFAGSAIGLVRNMKSIPWVDDYDIIVFDKDIKILEKALDIIKKNLFFVKPVEKNKKLIGFIVSSPRYNLYTHNTSFFQIDIFLTKIENNKNEKIIRNIMNWGLYDSKNINLNIVSPPNYQEFDDIILPFFNQYKKDIEIEYGDVFNSCSIHLAHGREKIHIKRNWIDCYNDFNKIEENSIENTKKLFYVNDKIIEHVDTINDVDLLGESYITLMKRINSLQSSTKYIHIYNSNNIKYVYDIKYFFPNTKIYFYISNPIICNDMRFFLEKIDYLVLNSKKLYPQIEELLDNFIIFNKPVISLPLEEIAYPIINEELKKENYKVYVNENKLTRNKNTNNTHNNKLTKTHNFDIEIEHEPVNSKKIFNHVTLNKLNKNKKITGTVAKPIPEQPKKQIKIKKI